MKNSLNIKSILALFVPGQGGKPGANSQTKIR
jgi:hypothetical protein